MGVLTSAGLLVGLGQGVQNGVGTIFKARKEQQDQQRLDAQVARQNRLEDDANQREKDADARARFNTQLSFNEKGGRIKPLNGTEHIGFTVGSSTASTQPSEYDDNGVAMESVGDYNGERYYLPKDRLTPGDRLKQNSRSSRAADAMTAFPNLHLTPGKIAAMHLDDAEMGDDNWKEAYRQNFELDPANVNNKIHIAGAEANARADASWNAYHRDPSDPDKPETRAQRNANLRSVMSGEHSNERQARQDIVTNKEPKKADYNYDPTSQAWPADPKGSAISPDSVAWEGARKEAFGARTRARLSAADHGFAADSAMHELSGPVKPDQAAIAHLKKAHDAYIEAFHEAKNDGERDEATGIYRSIEEEILGNAGRKKTKNNDWTGGSKKNSSGGGTSF